MKKTLVFHLEGLIARFNPLSNEIVISKEFLEKINSLKDNYFLILVSQFSREKFENLKDFNLVESFFDKRYFLRDLSSEKRSNFLKNLKETKSFPLEKYYFGEVFPSFNLVKNSDFFVKVLLYPELDLDKNLNFNGSLISLDLDGVFNDLSNFFSDIFKIQKRELEIQFQKNLSQEEFNKIRKNLSNEEKKQLKRKSYSTYAENEKLVPWIRNYVKRLSMNNTLVLFSVTSKQRIEKFLNKHGLKEYFSKIYSSKDDFNSPIKESFMFEFIKKDFGDKKNFVHIGDNYYLDYLAPSSADFKAYLVDNYSYEKVLVDSLGNSD